VPDNADAPVLGSAACKPYASQTYNNNNNDNDNNDNDNNNEDNDNDIGSDNNNNNIKSQTYVMGKTVTHQPDGSINLLN